MRLEAAVAVDVACTDTLHTFFGSGQKFEDNRAASHDPQHHGESVSGQ